MSKAKDVTGQRFGWLTAQRPTAERTNDQSIIWECLCSCGKTKNVGLGDLRSGGVKSCGCRLLHSLEKRRYSLPGRVSAKFAADQDDY